MSATRNRSLRRPTENLNHASILALVVVLPLVGLAGCRSPLGGQAALKADLSLSFIVSGAERLALEAASRRSLSDGSTDSAAARLLLPTAASLEVTLTPEPVGNTIAAEPVRIVAGTATVPVSLSAVPYGNYTVKAEAKDGSGVVRFTQTAQLTVGDSELSATLNLVPTDPAGAALAATTLHDIEIAELSAGEARTWLVAPGSWLLAARSILLAGLEGESRAFLQTADGTLVSDPLGTSTRLSTAGLPAGEPAYLTVYNGGSAALPAVQAVAGPVLVPVSAGAFQRDATPANTTYVSEFRIDRYEVSRAQFRAVMGVDPVTANSNGMSDPVHGVNWYHAIAYCNKLSVAEGLTPVYGVAGVSNWAGLAFASIPNGSAAPAWDAATVDWAADGYRLPTEMEWRWAAMGGMSDARDGDINGGVNTGGYTKGYPGSVEVAGAQATIGAYAWLAGHTTQTVGTKLPNELGIYDMSGNVWEWCWDWYDSYPANHLVNYTGAATATNRMFLGGCFSDLSADPPKVANRAFTERDPCSGAPGVGLRVARGVLPTYSRASFVEDAEALTVGSNNLNGQNGWVADTTGGTSTQVVTGHGVNATNMLASSAVYKLSSHALGVAIDMTDPKKAYRLSYDSVKPTWGTHFGIAADMNGNGVIEPGEEVWNFRVDSSGTTPDLAYLVRPSGEISASIASIPGLVYDTWFQTELYFTQGLITIRVKPWSTGVWTTVWADESLETTANSDRTNPSNWSHLYFSMAAIDGYLDNISFEIIALP